MRIDMWLDTCDPWSYLGLRHLRTAVSRCEHGTEIEVYLHAYLLDPDLEAALDKPRIVALVESGAASLEEVREADERMRALGAREGIRFDFDSLIIAPTSRAHRVIAAAHDADIDNDTVAGPDSLHLKVAARPCRPRCWRRGMGLARLLRLSDGDAHGGGLGSHLRHGFPIPRRRTSDRHSIFQHPGHCLG